MSPDILTREAPKADYRIPYGQDANQFGDLRLPAGAGPWPVVVVLHGGFWRAAYDLGYAGHMSAALTAQGWATWNIEYRRIGQMGGGWPGTFDDVAAAVDVLAGMARKHALDLRTVVALGHSAGGHLALWLAARKDAKVRVTSAVGLAAVSDLRKAWTLRLSNGVAGELLGGPPEKLAERYRAASPAERLPAGVPLRLIHGERDNIVPVEISRAFVKEARKAGDDAEFILLEGADHFDAVDPRSKEWKRVEQTVARLRKSG